MGSAGALSFERPTGETLLIRLSGFWKLSAQTPAITDAQKPLAFSLVRVTGLKSPADFHNTGLTVIPEDKDHLTQEWLYDAKGKSGKNVFQFTRVRRGGS